MRKQDKLKNIEVANKKLLREFDIDSYEETSESGFNKLKEYLQPLVDQGLIHGEIRDDILDLAESYADDMWREGARDGFADR